MSSVVQLSHAVMKMEQFHGSLREGDCTETIALHTPVAHASAEKWAESGCKAAPGW